MSSDPNREYPDRPFVAVGVVVTKDDKVLLVRRGKPPNDGHWSLPGGAQGLGETVREAAVREVLEETGLSIELDRLLDAVDFIDRDDQGAIRHQYTLIDFSARWVAGEPSPDDDVVETAWARRDDLASFALWSETLRIIDEAAAKSAKDSPPGRDQ